MPVVMGPTAEVEELRGFVDRVLATLTHEALYVSDGSTVSELLEDGDSAIHWDHERDCPFRFVGDPAVTARNDETLARAMETLKVPVERHNRIVEVARWLREYETGRDSFTPEEMAEIAGEIARQRLDPRPCIHMEEVERSLNIRGARRTR
jgi:hypothetical protein